MPLFRLGPDFWSEIIFVLPSVLFSFKTRLVEVGGERSEWVCLLEKIKFSFFKRSNYSHRFLFVKVKNVLVFLWRYLQLNINSFMTEAVII